MPCGIVTQARIDRRGLWVRVVQDTADQGEAVPRLRQPGAYRAPQIVEPHVFNARCRADPSPGLLDVHEMVARLGAGQEVEVAFLSGEGSEQGERRERERDVVNAAGFRLAQAELTADNVHIVPSCFQQLRLPYPRQEIEPDCRTDVEVWILRNRRSQPWQFFWRDPAVAFMLLELVDAAGRIGRGLWEKAPAPRQLEHLPQECDGGSPHRGRALRSCYAALPHPPG